MNRSHFPLVVAFAVLAVGAFVPACSCNHNQNHCVAGMPCPNGGGGGGGGGGSGGGGGANVCGDQSSGCMAPCVGPTCMPPAPFPPGGGTGVGVGPCPDGTQGCIVLNKGSAGESNYLWIADDQNYWVGMVSKVDTRVSNAPQPNGSINKKYREVARYLTVTCDSGKAANSKPDHTGIVVGGANAQMLGPATGANACLDVTGKQVQLYHNRPSRTAVDFNGDAWVANRAHDNFGGADPHDGEVRHFSSVTKFANRNNSITDTDCIDRNGNGKIDTSFDANGDGIINTDCDGDGVPDSLGVTCKTNTPQEFFGIDDECILFTTNTGGEGGTGRPLALGKGAVDFGPSDAWAGRWTDGVYYRIDGADGHIKATTTMKANGKTCAPYGAAIDQFGILWSGDSASTNNLFYFDTANPTNVGMVTCPSVGQAGHFYGIAVDGWTAGGKIIQNVWLGGCCGSVGGAFRYTPDRTGFATLGKGKFTEFDFTGSTLQGRGIGVDNRQPTAFAWVALDGPGAVGRIDVASTPQTPDGNVTNTIVSVPVTSLFKSNGGVTTLGAGVAIDLDVWAIHQSNDATTAVPTNLTHYSVDKAGNVTPPTAADQVRIDDNGITAGAPTHQPPHPYTYSDFTGFGLRNFTNPFGAYTYTFTGCGAMMTKWIKITWSADTSQAGTSITVKARSADTAGGLASAAWTGNYTSSPADLSQAPGPLSPNPSGFVEVEFDLKTSIDGNTPGLKSFSVAYECAVPVP